MWTDAERADLGERLRALIAAGGRLAPITAGHPYPGQRYRHGWIPVAGFDPKAYAQRRHESGHVEIGHRTGGGVTKIGTVHRGSGGQHVATHANGSTTSHRSEGEARSAVIRGHQRHTATAPSRPSKPFHEMTKAEYEAAAGPGKRWVYHASEDPHAFDQGVKMANVPQNLARQRYEAGEHAEFAPGAGLGKGTYVGGEAHNVDSYGHYLHAFAVPKEHLAVPPEARGYRPHDAEYHLNEGGTGALLTHDVPANHVVNMGRIRNNGFTGHEVHQLNALREGKHVPEENMSPRVKFYRDRYLRPEPS